MKTPPEYALAEALIEHLAANDALKACVYPEPWDRTDQCQNLALAAAQHELALAVSPQPPEYLDADKAAAGYLEARLAVTALSTTQVQGGLAARRVAALAGEAIVSLLRWDYEAAGIPYALPRLISVDPMDFSGFPDMANLSGQTILIGKSINYRTYYGN